MKEKVQTPYIQIWEEENILHCMYSEKLDITLDIAKHCVQQRFDFSERKSYACLIDAREYFATEGAKFMNAGALLIRSPLTRMLGNLFIGINKPNVPTKLFTDEKEAKKWLQQYI